MTSIVWEGTYIEEDGPYVGKGMKGKVPATVARVDVSDRFVMRRAKNGDSELRYGSVEIHGIEVAVDKRGLLGVEIRGQGDSETMGSGRDMLIGAMERPRREGIHVNRLRGFWIVESDSVNAAQFLRNSKTMTPEEAAANTWTGRIAHDLGFSRVESVKQSPGRIVVIFVRGQ